jgi:Predicted glycosyltransferases
MNTLPGGPVGVYDVEIGDPLPRLPPVGGSGSVRVLVRMHTRPVAELVVPMPRQGLEPEQVAEALAEVMPFAAEHLAVDGMSTGAAWSVHPEGQTTEPACLRRRRMLGEDGPQITVLIATRDRPDSLLRCLRSIALLEYRHFDVVIVDNAPSTDDTRQAVAGWQEAHPDVPVRYLLEPRPGAALAHNRGLEVATGAWVARTDDDVVVDPHWLSAIAEAVASEPGVGCVTGLILPAEVGTPAQALLEQFGGYARGFERRCYDLNGHRPAEDRLFPFTMGRLGSGANMAFDAAQLRARGGFDTALGPGTVARGGEDLLALFQVITAGGQVVYEPSALVWHWNRRDYASLRRLVHDYGIGLSAYLTSAVVHEPRLLSVMLRQAVPGAMHALRRSSVKNQGKHADYPRELERLELLGMLKGPLAYMASRWEHRSGGSGGRTPGAPHPGPAIHAQGWRAAP